eukprot:NODE_6155_length_875_cov_97.347074_g5924_i0.p1 GENE.NODE_6155_length_875_cov_97.347074_g5924_i0~~NODE_6155_length_875_cov_97.347074_g5924_i0.p1  ORF type:complete len:231 (-),score=35.03 NODE_6155_length_875_cov_97.347074_g5924_i0:183-821(-)
MPGITCQAKCGKCKNTFSIEFQFHEINNGVLPLPPDNCPQCEAGSETNPAIIALIAEEVKARRLFEDTCERDLIHVTNRCKGATSQETVTSSKDDVPHLEADTAEAFAIRKCSGCLQSFRLGFSVDSVLSGDVSLEPPAEWKCKLCSKSSSSPFLFERPSGIPAPPANIPPPKLGRAGATTTAPSAGADPDDVFDSMFEMDSEGNSLVRPSE